MPVDIAKNHKHLQGILYCSVLLIVSVGVYYFSWCRLLQRDKQLD